jgi:calpain-5
MEFGDFLNYFNEISICRIINTSLLTIRKTWSESYAFGKWRMPDRAGGCINNRNTFCFNPQFIFEIDTGGDDKPDEVLINLDQANMRSIGKEQLTIGFFVMRVEDNRKYRLHQPKPKAASSTYINSRSVFLRQKLANGRYVVIPSTFDSNVEGDFLLRVYTDNSNYLKELTKDCPTPFMPKFNPFAKFAACVTSILVKSCANLVNADKNGEPFDTYVVIKCEKSKIKGRIFKSSLNPKWETSAIFYRYQKGEPIKIEVWIRRTLKDEQYGELCLDAEPNNKYLSIECNLNEPSNGAANGATPGAKSGRMTIEIQSMNNIRAI